MSLAGKGARCCGERARRGEGEALPRHDERGEAPHDEEEERYDEGAGRYDEEAAHDEGQR